MRTVNIAELKNRLSSYITYAESGEEIVIRHRNRPVARLIPFVAHDETEEELALVAAGIMRLPLERFDVDAFLDLPIPLPTGNSPGPNPLTKALLDERNEGR
jgi:prevent-host-death family protein